MALFDIDFLFKAITTGHHRYFSIKGWYTLYQCQALELSDFLVQ